MDKLFIILGSINAFLAVSLGAFGAHILKGRLPVEMMTVYHTAVQYHLIHALGLLCVGILAQQWNASLYLKGTGWLLTIGILLFSGSLYAFSISGIRGFVILTPFGGIAFLLAWLLLIISAIKA